MKIFFSEETENFMCVFVERLSFLQKVKYDADVQENFHILDSLSSRASSSVIVSGMQP